MSCAPSVAPRRRCLVRSSCDGPGYAPSTNGALLEYGRAQCCRTGSTIPDPGIRRANGLTWVHASRTEPPGVVIGTASARELQAAASAEHGCFRADREERPRRRAEALEVQARTDFRPRLLDSFSPGVRNGLAQRSRVTAPQPAKPAIVTRHRREQRGRNVRVDPADDDPARRARRRRNVHRRHAGSNRHHVAHAIGGSLALSGQDAGRLGGASSTIRTPRPTATTGGSRSE